jgi:hypothetical protein
VPVALQNDEFRKKKAEDVSVEACPAGDAPVGTAVSPFAKPRREGFETMLKSFSVTLLARAKASIIGGPSMRAEVFASQA